MCGIFGVWNCSVAAVTTYEGLKLLQHRAKEFAGIAVSNGEEVTTLIGKGLVKKALPFEDVESLEGSHAIGHVRYATAGVNGADNNAVQIFAQPLKGWRNGESVALAHNGNIANVAEVCEAEDIFCSRSNFIDTEIILERFCRHTQGTLLDAVKHAVKDLKGSYCLMFLLKDRMIIVRDAKGNRPLVMGRFGGTVYFASETCAFDGLSQQVFYEREVHPGEVIELSKDGMYSSYLDDSDPNPGKCAFCLPYLGSPASTIFGQDVAQFRINLGRLLGQSLQFGVDEIDIVMGAPDSANYIGIGVAQELGVMYMPGLMRSHYSGRSFIEPTQRERDRHVEEKFIAVPGVLKGKRVLIVDDSIVRLTTMPVVVKKLFAGGAREVHVGIATPPIVEKCQYGIDTPRRTELIAAKHDCVYIQEAIGATSLHYMPLQAYYHAFDQPQKYCFECWER